MIGTATMSILENLGFRQPSQKPDPDATLACVNDAVDRALQLHHEARVAIRQGNGRVINLLNDALRPDTAAEEKH